jgi:carbamoyltransferase
MIILGLGGLQNDPASIVVKDGSICAAVEERKLTRRHRPGELPLEAIDASLQLAGASATGIDLVAVARPLAERGDAKLHLQLREKFPSSRVLVVEHHLAHAASAYYASPFDEATILTLDRVGDFRCGARWHASGNQIHIDEEMYYPDSVADLYGRVTELLGFEPRADEHKVQWLSASGNTLWHGLFEEILTPAEGSSPRLDRTFLDTDRLGRGGFSAKFYERLKIEDESPVDEKQKPHVAAGLQHAVERAVIAMAGTGGNLCLAGGLTQNALLIAALERSGRWTNVFVQPAGGNSGTALGAALHAWHHVCQRRERVPFETLALGPAYSSEQIKQVLENCKLRFRFLLTAGELVNAAVERLGHDQIVAWMQGRMEFGPRALGNRSLLASPLNVYSAENLNIFIKRRENFRKFAASVPAERAAEYFEVGPNARFLATVGRVKEQHRKTFEGAILGRDQIRVHTVDKAENPLFHNLLTAWGDRTGLPVLYNTSFNLFGDPMVCTPRDAVRSYYSSGVDSLFVGNFLLEK